MMMAQKAKETKDYLDNLTKDILSLRNETDDPVFDKYLSNAYNELSEFYYKDLANNQIISQINAKDRQIREALVEYNKQKKSKLDSNENNSVKIQSANTTTNESSIDYYNQSITKYNNQDFEGAFSDINRAVKNDPNNAKAYYMRGYQYLYQKRNFDLAIQDFTKCIQMKPDINEAFFYRGLAYHEQKMHVEGIKDFTECIKSDKRNTDALFLRALSKSELKDLQGAINDYEIILNLEGQVEPKIYKMSTVYNNKAFSLVGLGKYKDALPFVNKALKLDETEAYIWDTRGEIYYKIGEYTKCITDMDKAISIGEGDNSYYYRGLSKMKLGNKPEGCLDLSKAGELGKSEAYEAIKKFCN